jgi:glycosyltransferase involved in cell wall biosynthesis
MGTKEKTISAVINTCDEEKYLEGCLSSLKPWTTEIVVVDMHSKDKSRQIAKKFGCKIFMHERLPYVEPARKFGVDKASGDWVCYFDPDERVPETLGIKIKEFIEGCDEDVSAISIPIKYMFWGTWPKHVWGYPGYQARCFKKGKATFSDRIHEPIRIDGRIKKLPALEDFSIQHLNYESIEHFVSKMNRYTTIEAKNMKEIEGRQFKIIQLFYHPLREFWFRFIRLRGYKDGIDGFVLSVLMAFYRFLSFAKIRDIERENEKKTTLS